MISSLWLPVVSRTFGVRETKNASGQEAALNRVQGRLNGPGRIGGPPGGAKECYSALIVTTFTVLQRSQIFWIMT
jgi:hypothetical protein